MQMKYFFKNIIKIIKENNIMYEYLVSQHNFALD